MNRINNLVLTIGGIVGLLLFAGCSPANDEDPDVDEIVIGVQADLSGGISSWGVWIERAAKAAVDKINRDGGISGRKVRYVVEDTGSDPSAGSRKLRKLIEHHGADFIVGSVHSGVMMASLPIAKELDTLYFPIAMASEATGKDGNQNTFRISTHVRQQVEASADWVMRDPAGPNAKRWAIFVSDYAWGWSHEKWFTKAVEDNGGEVVSSTRIPQGTRDFFPYLAGLPEETESVYFVFFGADSINFVQQLYESGYRRSKFTPVCTLEAIDIASLGAAADGAWVLEYLPRNLDTQDVPEELKKTYDHSHHHNFREALGVDERGRSIGNPDTVMACSHCWAAYQIVHLIKETVEETGWSGREDNHVLISALESSRMSLGERFPQGDNEMRAEDHQGFHQHWMSRVENGELHVKFRIPVGDVVYEPTIDLPAARAN